MSTERAAGAFAERRARIAGAAKVWEDAGDIPEKAAMSQAVRISAKTLGGLALPDFCPRCFWLQMRVRALPYQILPGIFSSIDSYVKKIVQGWFERHGGAPPWLQELGDIRRSIRPPHYSKFSVCEDDVTLRGEPDGIFQMRDGSYTIVDYKTAKFTAMQDELFPMYEGQLNAYAHIGERYGFRPVSQLALAYTQPATDDATAHDEANLTGVGFRMPFSAHIVKVKRKPKLIPKLLRRARQIAELDSPPASLPGCEDCERLAELISLAGG
jgi:PD-(D/E)XK nuclease superfamily